VCSELKQEKYMRAYVEEAGGTSLCALATGLGCSEREMDFIVKMKGGAKDPKTELARLVAISESGSMKPELLAWLNQRISILQQFDIEGKEEL
jgi:hypothetical protein